MKAEELTQKVNSLCQGVSTFSWSDLQDPNNTEARLFQSTERGETFEFFDGEIFELVPQELVRFRPKKFDGGVSLSIAIVRNGLIEWMPIAILRRTCGLVDERGILSKENTIGNPLRANMSDVARVELLYRLTEQKPIKVNVVHGCHQNRYERGKSPIYDSPTMDEKDRRPLRAYRFNLA